MDDHPPSRRLRLLAAGFLLLLVWGTTSSVAADVRSDSPSSQLVLRAATPRLAAGRVTVDQCDALAFAAPYVELEEVRCARALPDFGDAPTVARGVHLYPARLPRPPPAHSQS